MGWSRATGETQRGGQTVDQDRSFFVAKQVFFRAGNAKWGWLSLRTTFLEPDARDS